MKKKILQDHKLTGKIFSPPLTYKLGPLHETSWTKTMLPELLWLALIQDYYGDIKGVELITLMTRLARNCDQTDKKHIFATISSFTCLTPEVQSSIQTELANTSELEKIQKALLPLIVYYPACPLKFIYSTKPSLSEECAQNLERIKRVVRALYDKTSRYAMMVQATAIWLAFDAEALKVFKGLALACFPEIEKYPETELSKKVAGSIRASIHMLFGQPHYPTVADWPGYFWTRGLKIDRCHFADETESE